MIEKPIKIFIVEDHSLVKDGIITLLKDFPEFSVVGEAQFGIEAVEKIIYIKPDVVLLDISLPDLTGIEVMKIILATEKEKKINFLILSMFDSEEYIYRAIKSGASGLLNKNISQSELKIGIKKTYNGKMYFGDKLSLKKVKKIIEKYDSLDFQNKDPENIYLSKRELEVLFLIQKGLLTKEIADKLFLKKRTIDFYRTTIFQKCNVQTVGELLNLTFTNERLKRQLKQVEKKIK